MSREARRRKLEHRLKELERDYIVFLDAALQECRDGKWGLFGHNDHLLKVDSPADTLVTMGESIQQFRQELGIIPPFEPHSRFMHCRNLRGPNAPGEPKLAEALLHELRAHAPTLPSE